MKTIIRWQISQDIAAEAMKIDLLAFIQDLLIKDNLTKCNVNIIFIKSSSAIKILNPEHNKEAVFYTYQ